MEKVGTKGFTDFLADLCEPMPVAKKVEWLLKNNSVIVIHDIPGLRPRSPEKPAAPEVDPFFAIATSWRGRSRI